MPVAILIDQYVVLPLAGLLAGWTVMRVAARHGSSSEWIDGARAIRIISMLFVGAAAVMGWMVTARYATWHSFVFDLGSYDQKVWLIAQRPSLGGMWEQTYKGGVHLSPCGINWYWGICHFQPLLLIPGLVYKIWDSPLVLLWLQVLLVVSGMIPAFLLARDTFNSPTAGVIVTLLYLLYPAVQYNGVLDFRPDHVAIPTMLWAYFLAGRGRYFGSLLMVGLGSLAKETLILNAACFGLYLAVRHRQRVMGGLVFVLGVVAFYLVMFHLLRFGQFSEGRFNIDRFFPTLSGLLGGTASPGANGAGILQALMQKRNLLYLEALFVPLAFLPLLALPELIPAIPSLAISLLSVNPDHASIDAQYSASVVAPAFAAMLMSVTRLQRVGARMVTPVPVLAGAAVLCLFVSLGLGPTPLSRNFWNADWGGRWHLAQYRNDRQDALERATTLIPSDPKAIVVVQNDINSARIAHRDLFFAFPNLLDRAEYVLVDRGRQPYVYWTWDPQCYRAFLRGLQVAPAYHIIFDEGGVLLFERRKGHVGSLTQTAATVCKD